VPSEHGPDVEIGDRFITNKFVYRFWSLSAEIS